MARSIHVIPSEVILLCLIYLDIKALVRCSHVCRRWRELAHISPVFWRDILLYEFTPAGVALFLARTDICTAPGLSITFCEYEEEEDDVEEVCALYTEVLLPCLARNMHRIRQLEMSYLLQATPELAATLNMAAPNLEELTLNCHCPTDNIVNPVIPHATFSGVCPRLRSLQLLGVDLPNDIIPAFANIEDLTLAGSWITFIPPTLFECMPRLEKLRISATDITRLSDKSLAPIPASIASVSLCLTHGGSAAFLRCIEAGLPSLRIDEPDSPNVSHALRHLSGSLQLNLWCHDLGCLLIQYVDRGRVRAFRHGGSKYATRWPSDAYFSEQVANKITVLRISTAILATLAAIPSLDACQTLVLHVTRKQDQLRVPQSASLHLPALRTICIHTAYYETDLLSGGDVVEALDALLSAPASRPLLHLAGYPGVSDEDTILARYDLAIVRQHSEPCAQCGEHVAATLPVDATLWMSGSWDLGESFRHDPETVDALSKAGLVIC